MTLERGEGRRVGRCASLAGLGGRGVWSCDTIRDMVWVSAVNALTCNMDLIA